MSDQEFNKIFSKRLKHYLNEHDMTQTDLARLLGVSTQSVTNWCKGTKSPRMDKVDAMCKIFNCKRSDFMEEKYLSDDSESPIIIEINNEARNMDSSSLNRLLEYARLLNNQKKPDEK